MFGADDTLLAALVLGAISFGIGLVLVTAQGRSRTSLGIGGAYIGIAIAVPLANYLGGDVEPGPAVLARVEGLCEAGAMLMTFVYIGGLIATAHARPHVERRLHLLLWTGVGLTAVLALVGLVAPVARLNDFEFKVFESGGHRPMFWVFVTLWSLAMLVTVACYALVARAQLDHGERVRSIYTLIAAPLLVGALMVPRLASLPLVTAAAILGLYGQYRFAVAQGERSAFLSRFLSPQVAEHVRMDGLGSVMQPGELEITVVACDLRGFTSYAEGVPSQAVIDLLGEYYDAVGHVVAEVDGTIKDYAGDGILILVGAPIPRPDHASVGLALARRIHEVTGPVLDRWSTGPHPLGLGVGAASGRVTVGAIGSDARMEYTAVGIPVNLAARLCSTAAAGETLVDQRLAAVGTGLVEREPVRLKGFGAEIPVFAAP